MDMKTFLIGVPASLFIWGIVFFIYGFDAKYLSDDPEIYFIPEQLEFMESQQRLIQLNCDFMKRRHDFNEVQLAFLQKEVSLIEGDSIENIIYKIEIDSSILKKRYHHE